jgi:RNA polymerase sigma-70 factor (ECF subfamily)
MDRELLEAAFHDALARARAAWPTVSVAPDAFVAYVADRLPHELPVLAALASVHPESLYVACACARGDPHAIAALESAFFHDCDAALARMSPDPAFVDDVKQRVRAKLFVSDGDRPPRMATYSGAGDLRTFLRVLTIREAISMRRSRNREILSDDPRPVEPWDTRDPELLHLRDKYAAEFESAFRQALAALTSEQRNLLRYHYVDRLSIDHIGAIQGTHRVTASRRLNRVRDALVEDTRRRLAAQLDLRSADVASVLRLIQSVVDISLRTALEAGNTGKTA